MGKVLLSWVNWIDRAATTIITSSEAPPLRVTRIAEAQARRRWRTAAGVTAADFTADFGQTREVGVVALQQPDDAGGINADSEARGWFQATDTVRHRLDASTAGAGALYDSTALAGGWVPGIGIHMARPSSPVSARYWKADVNAPSLSGIGSFDIGRAWAGPAWQPARGNMAYRWGYSHDDGSVVDTNARSGLDFVDRGPRRRVVTFALEVLTPEDAAAMAELQRIAGTGGQVLFAADPDEPTESRNWIIGRIAQVQAITQPFFGIFSMPFQIRQSL